MGRGSGKLWDKGEVPISWTLTCRWGHLSAVGDKGVKGEEEGEDKAEGLGEKVEGAWPSQAGAGCGTWGGVWGHSERWWCQGIPGGSQGHNVEDNGSAASPEKVLGETRGGHHEDVRGDMRRTP